MTIGPAIEDGFYYDFARDEPFTPADLEEIEARMAEIRSRDETVEREVWSRDDAVEVFQGMGEHYKAELIAAIPEGEAITLYRQGDFVDLCRGPHLPSTGKVGAFKLLKVAGAYWRGDSRNEMLQRIYGTAWPDDKQLKAYLHRLEEAEKRDHRRLGREMGLFHFQEEAPGAAFWHPKGWTLFRTLVDYMRARQDAAGYHEVSTPDIMDSVLWEASGHWQTFREHMFTSQTEDGRHYAIKPMNCPGHVQVYKRGIKSYRDLPLRISEFGKVHRYEPSGALHGLLRVRAFSQDDAHIFCTPEQTEAECRGVDRALPRHLPRLRLRRRADQVRRPAAQAHRRRRGLGPPGSCTQGRAREHGDRLQPQSRRGRVLRAEAGVRAARRDRARMAVRHAPGRPETCRSASTPTTSARTARGTGR